MAVHSLFIVSSSGVNQITFSIDVVWLCIVSIPQLCPIHNLDHQIRMPDHFGPFWICIDSEAVCRKLICQFKYNWNNCNILYGRGWFVMLFSSSRLFSLTCLLYRKVGTNKYQLWHRAFNHCHAQETEETLK